MDGFWGAIGYDWVLGMVIIGSLCHHCRHKGFLESPPSFCNGLGTIYIASFRERTIDLTTRDMSSEFRYAFGKVLGTQDRPTLRLASHHCVLHLNLIKNNFNTCILNSHTH